MHSWRVKGRFYTSPGRTGVPGERSLLDGVEQAWVKMSKKEQRAEGPTYRGSWAGVAHNLRITTGQG
jgi:hypothetical protein